jgi:indole-3-glycerol phosphate synthase
VGKITSALLGNFTSALTDGTYQQDPFDYLQKVRAEQGLPVRSQDPAMGPEHEPEL